MKTEFKEEQKFTQWWLWLILIGIGTLPLYGIYSQFILGEKMGTNPMSDVGLLLFSVFVFCFLLLFYLMRLKTEIDQDEIRMNFFPFVKKRIPWNQIKKADVVNYGFVGGWGIRLWTSYGTVYNTKGDRGLAIELLDGKKLLIGTQKEAALKAVLEKIENNKT
ncbi:MAG: hypothetical protein ACI828_000656 [Flavobacteriales bacterium]|jgi:hypothetical protein